MYSLTQLHQHRKNYNHVVRSASSANITEFGIIFFILKVYMYATEEEEEEEFSVTGVHGTLLTEFKPTGVQVPCMRNLMPCTCCECGSSMVTSESHGRNLVHSISDSAGLSTMILQHRKKHMLN